MNIPVLERHTKTVILMWQTMVICMWLCEWCNEVKITAEMLGKIWGLALQEFVLPERGDIGYCERGYAGLC